MRVAVNWLAHLFLSEQVAEIIPRFMRRAREVGVSQALEAFEAFINLTQTPGAKVQLTKFPSREIVLG